MSAEPRGVVGDGSPTGARTCHCGLSIAPRDPDPWEGRMDDYCTSCAANRCDCYPDECPVERAVASSSGTGHDAAVTIKTAYGSTELTTEEAQHSPLYAADALAAAKAKWPFAAEEFVLVQNPVSGREIQPDEAISGAALMVPFSTVIVCNLPVLGGSESAWTVIGG